MNLFAIRIWKNTPVLFGALNHSSGPTRGAYIGDGSISDTAYATLIVERIPLICEKVNVIQYYESYKFDCKFDKLHGTYKHWIKHERILLYKSMSFKNGKPHGYAIDMYETGEIFRKIRYKNGYLHGKSRKYFNNNRLEWVKTYTNGILNGQYELYNNDGKPNCIGSCINGEFIGTLYEYYGIGGSVKKIEIKWNQKVIFFFLL